MGFSKLIAIILFGLGPFIPSSNGEILNRFERIREWAVMEDGMFWMAKAHAQRLEDELTQLNSFIRDYEETTLAHLDGIKMTGEGVKAEDPDENEDLRADVVASNPLLVHQLSHRLVTIVAGLQRQLLKVDKDGEGLKKMLAAFIDPNFVPDDIIEVEQTWPELGSHQQYFPVRADLEDALQSLAIIYDTYQSRNITPKNFAAALSPETSQPMNINAFQAVQISLKSFYMGLYGNAIDWIVYAVERSANQDIRDYSISRDIIESTRAFIVKTHNTEFENPAHYFVSPTTSLNFYNGSIPSRIMSEEENRWMKRRNSSYLYIAVETENLALSPAEKLLLSYYSMCEQGGRSRRVNMKLKCYLKKSRPFFILRPLKVEELSKIPKILHFYDVLEVGELDQLRLLVVNLQMDADVNGDGENRHSPDNQGTRALPRQTGVESRIVIGEEENVLKRLGRKMGFLLGVDGTKLFRLTEYVGGRYDALQNFGESQNATSILQFQLNSVEKGGESILGQYGPVVLPVEGSALYWEASIKENEDGSVKNELWSGSCPVVKGHKLSTCETEIIPLQ